MDKDDTRLRICENCKFWQMPDLAGNLNLAAGECHRRCSAFPARKANEWCGEWEANISKFADVGPGYYWFWDESRAAHGATIVRAGAWVPVRIQKDGFTGRLVVVGLDELYQEACTFPATYFRPLDDPPANPPACSKGEET